MESDEFSRTIILLLLIILSSFFSATETAFIEFSRVRMKGLANSGVKKANIVLKIDEDFDGLMSTLLICITLVNIIATTLGIVIFSKYFENNGIFISTIIMIAIIIFLAEITPKAIASQRPEAAAIFTSSFVKLFIFIISPINLLINYWKKVISLFVKAEIQPSITEDKLINMIDEVENEGGINKSESDLIRSAIEFNDTMVEDIYTPRIDIVAIDREDTIDYIKEKFLQSGYSRLPVFQDDIDNIIGVIHEKDFYQSLYRKEKDFFKSTSKVLYVTPNKKISELIKDLQLSKAHMAIVVDEYGGTAGLVTMEDILEELVGEIWDEHDEVFEWFTKIDDNKYLISCNADIDDMFELLSIEPDEELDVTTVNGWITMLFEGIPQVGMSICFKNLDITVTKAEANRVLEISVEKNNSRCDFTI